MDGDGGQRGRERTIHIIYITSWPVHLVCDCAGGLKASKPISKTESIIL